MSQQLLTPGYVRSDYPVPPPLSGSSNRDSLGSSFGGSVTFDHRISFLHSRAKLRATVAARRQFS